MHEKPEALVRIGAPAVAVAGAAAWFHGIVGGGDTWWHLAAGREMALRGGLVPVDPFSHTAAGQPWQNHEWLWDIGAWLAYAAHPEWLAWLNQLVLIATFALLFFAAKRASASVLAAGVALWLAAAAAHPFLDLRPQTTALGWIALFLVTRQRSIGPWLWPPLVVIWVNTHASFLFGVGAIGLHVLVTTFEESRARGRISLPRREWIALTLSLACVLANPYGLGLLEHPFAYVDANSPWRQIAEWSGTDLRLAPASFEGRFWLLFGVALVGLRGAVRRDPYLALLFLVSFVMAVLARKFVPLFAVCAAPVVAISIAELVEAAVARAPVLGSRAARLATLALAATAVVGLWSSVRLQPRLLYRSIAGFDYSAGAVAYLDGFERPVRLFNDFGMGGYLLFRSPNARVFIDGRSNTLYDDQVYLDYATIASTRPGYPKVLANRGVEVVVVAPGDPLVHALQSLDPPWQVGYRDFLSAILVAPGVPVPPSPPGAASDPARLTERAREALAAGDAVSAHDQSRGALAVDPLFLHAYRVLMRAQALQRDAVGIERSVVEAVDRFPRMEGLIRGYEAEAWARYGDLERSREALLLARRHNPLRYGEFDEQLRRLDSAR